MSIFDMEEDKTDSSMSSLSSISGGVNYYEFQPGDKYLDIMEYLFRKRDEVSRTIQKHKHQFPQKQKLNFEMTPQKPLEEEHEKVSVLRHRNSDGVTFRDFR